MTGIAPRGLRRILGVGFGLAVIIGTILGIGILRTPGLVAAQLHQPSTILIAWLIGGLYTLIGAICFAELGTMLPQAGGYYVYARRAFGDTVGFAVGWTDWLTYCAVLGYVSIAIGEFAGALIPAVSASVKVVSIAALVALVVLQWMGLRVSSRFQEWTTALKCVAFLVLVGVCLAAPSTVFGREPAGALPPATLAGIVIALQSVAITYGGWQAALYFAEEDRDPGRNLPRSMIGGVVSVTIVYLLINVALLNVLPVADLARSTLPAADAAQRVLGGRGGQLITLLSLISLPPLLNGVLMIATRVLFAMGRDGMLWRRTALVNAGGTPAVATVLTTLVAVALIASGTFQKLVAMASFYLAANYCVCCLALIVLRRREPNLARPFRAWGYPWTAGIVLVGAAAFLIGTLVGDTANSVTAVGLLAAGLAVHAAIVKLSPATAAASRGIE